MTPSHGKDSTDAAKSVLAELVCLLGEYERDIVVIGERLAGRAENRLTHTAGLRLVVSSVGTVAGTQCQRSWPVSTERLTLAGLPPGLLRKAAGMPLP